MKKIKKHFIGTSRLVVGKDGQIKKFFTTASSVSQAERLLRRKMNKESGRVPTAYIPIDIEESGRCA